MGKCTGVCKKGSRDEKSRKTNVSSNCIKEHGHKEIIERSRLRVN